MVYTGSDGASVVSRLEYVAPDRFRLITETNLLADLGTVRQETVVIGSDAYSKSVVGGRWRRVPEDVGRAISKLREPLEVESLMKATDVKLIGRGKLDGSPTLVYQYSYDDTSNTGLKGVVKTWVGVKDGLPHQVESEGEAAHQGGMFKARTRVTYSDYNADIKIESPM